MDYMIKCKGLHCPQKETCERYTGAAHYPYQEYYARIPFSGGFCRYYKKSDDLHEEIIAEIFEPVKTVFAKPKREARKPVRKSKAKNK